MSIKILTVDDSKTIRLIVAKAFKPFDCVILEAMNGAEGLAVAANEKPDIIILDITMPVMDGYETLTRLKADPALKGIPVIMLTAEAGKENVVRIAKLGVRDYLIKPFKEELIVERVGRVVALKPKVAAVAIPKKIGDGVRVLVVEDKPAIIEQIKTGLANTSWEVVASATPDEAIAAAAASPVHIALVSLALPDAGSSTLYRALRADPRTLSLPVLGLAVKSAVEEQAKAVQLGFAGIITKPIGIEDLRAKVCRALSLDTTSQYFQQRESALVVVFPPEFNQGVANAVSSRLTEQADEAVGSGLETMVLDLSRLQTADFTTIKLVIEAIEISHKAGLRHGLIGSPAMVAACSNFEEAKSLSFFNSFEEAVSALATK